MRIQDLPDPVAAKADFLAYDDQKAPEQSVFFRLPKAPVCGRPYGVRAEHRECW